MRRASFLRARHILLVLLACALVGSARAEAEDARTRTRRGWDYEVTLAPDLKSAEVRICFRRLLPRQLQLKDTAALRALSFPDRAGRRATLKRSDKGDVVVPVGLRAGGCVTYRVDLDALTSAGGRAPGRVGRDRMLNPGRLLLRPTFWPQGVYVTCRFVCPTDLRVSVPWPDAAGSTTPYTYEVYWHALKLDGVLVIGRFANETVSASGAAFRVARLDRAHKATPEDVEAWISAAARPVASLFGRYPLSPVQVVLMPVPSYGAPVSFGRARRAGGASTIFYLSQNADRSSLVGEWVAVHEMIHLGMPWTPQSEAWFQEGFTTYYQEVLRTRAGFQTIEAGWQRIHEGFGRGRLGNDTSTIADASRRMHQTHGYWRVYWGGCAIALLCDMELRRVFKGTRSLDDVIRHLHRTHVTAGRAYMGLPLLEAADRWLGRPICAPIARRVLKGRGFPDLREAYRRLGLVASSNGIRLDPAAPEAATARAIMAPLADAR